MSMSREEARREDAERDQGYSPFEVDDVVELIEDEGDGPARVTGTSWSAPVRAREDEPGEAEGWEIEIEWPDGSGRWIDADLLKAVED